MTDTPKNAELAELSALGEQLYSAEAEVLRLEAELRRAKKRRDFIQCDLLPSTMEKIGLVEFRTPRSHIKVSEQLEVRPRADNRPLVLAALEKQGAGALIKTNLAVPFGKGEDEEVARVCEALALLGRDYRQDRAVHPQTLKKHIRDRLAKGDPVDVELFGVRQFQKAIFNSGAPEAPSFDEEEL